LNCKETEGTKWLPGDSPLSNASLSAKEKLEHIIFTLSWVFASCCLYSPLTLIEHIYTENIEAGDKIAVSVAGDGSEY
jgi:hypothetical protein